MLTFCGQILIYLILHVFFVSGLLSFITFPEDDQDRSKHVGVLKDFAQKYDFKIKVFGGLLLEC